MRAARWAPLLVVIVAAGAGGWWLLDRDADDPRTVEVAAQSPRFERLDDLVAAAGLVLEGTVVGVADGRAITDPLDASAGFETALASIDVERSGSPDVAEMVVVEQEARLLDGTPITVNGVAPLELGDHVILAVVVGATEEFPYTSPINEQAVFYVVDDEVVAADPDGPIGAAFHGEPADTLRDAIGLASGGRR